MENSGKKIFIILLFFALIGTSFCAVFFYQRSSKVIYKEKIVYKEEKAKKLEDIKKQENIVFLGDSITEFYPIDSIYRDLPIVKSGISGYTTDDLLERMNSMVYQYNPTSVYLLIGTNDIMTDGEATKDETVEKIEKIISDIKMNRSMAKIYLESIYPINRNLDTGMVKNRKNEIIREMNEALEKYCVQNQVTYIDMYKELIDSDGNFSKDYTDDGLHPNDLGYARISQIRLNYIYGIY